MTHLRQGFGRMDKVYKMSIKNKFATYSARIILVFSSFCLVICLLELNLRIFYEKKFVPQFFFNWNRYQPDSDLIYGFTPNSVTRWNTNEFSEEFAINSLGFRDDELIPKTENVIRIFVVGDSFTAGHGISTNDKTYPAVLEKILNTNIVNGKKYDVINTGVLGYTPDQEYRLITQKLIYLKPDIIIWNLHNGDMGDLQTMTTPPVYTISDDSLQLIPLSAKINWLYIQNYMFFHFPKLVENSYLLDYCLYHLPQISALNYKTKIPKDKISDWSKQKLLLEIESIYKFSLEKKFTLIINILPRKEDYEAINKNIGKKQFLENIEQSLSNKKIGVNLLIIERELDTYNDIIASGKGNPENKILGESTIDPKKLFYTIDFHPNELGHEIIASITAEFIKRKGLLD